MKLYHYYEKNIGPFRSISELSDEEAEGAYSQAACHLLPCRLSLLKNEPVICGN